MKLALFQLNFRVGDIGLNTAKIKQAIGLCKERGADLVVFSELSVCGYPPADMLHFDAFVDECVLAIHDIAAACHGIAAIVGAPVFNSQGTGKRLLNAAFLLDSGSISGQVYKALLPTYDIFDEYRYFEPATEFKTLMFKGKRLALTICEDIWNVDGNKLYPITPMDQLIGELPDLMINISASPFAWNRGPDRMHVLTANTRKYKLPLIYVNQLGANTDLIFDGGSCVLDGDGRIAAMIEPFREGFVIVDTDKLHGMEKRDIAIHVSHDEKNALIKEALILGIKDYFGKSGLQKAIVGLSGGLDSALTLTLAAAALGPDNVWAILMPGPYSSDHSVTDAKQLAMNLGVKHDIIPVSAAVESFGHLLHPFFDGTTSGIAEENIQARVRAVVLMALSNKFGHVLLNTSNKSESAVGYGTLYGDMSGGLSVIGDLYKTEVYDLARYINAKQEIIPENTITKPPSAELKPDQRDTDSLPAYDLLDAILFQFVEKARSPEQIIAQGYQPDVVNDVVRMVSQSEHKRKQAPPVLRVSQKSFGSGRRMPIVGKPMSRRPG